MRRRLSRQRRQAALEDRRRWADRRPDRGYTLTRARGRGERVQPNPRLRFGDAADKWLSEQVCELRPATIAIYANSVKTHLKPA
jgi:hypothetical protein